MIASLFKSNAEKLAARLADLEDEAQALEKRAGDARAAAADAQARLVEDLAEGLPVDDWRKKREAAEKKAADAERDLKTAQEAAGLVRERLEDARRTESLETLRRRYAAAQDGIPGAVEDLIAAGRAFSAVLGRFEGLRREVSNVHSALRAAGDEGAQYSGLPLVNDVLSNALGHAEGRQTEMVYVPIWPSAGGS